MKKRTKQQHISSLTPDVLSQMDQEALVSIILKLYEQNKQLSEQLQTYLKEKYGRKTERFEDPNQLRLGQEANTVTEPPKPAAPKKPGHTRNPMPSHLARKQLRRTPNQSELVCHCGTHRIKVNEVVRNRRYECVPVSLFVEEIIDAVWECPQCHDAVVVAADVCEPISNGSAGPQLLVKIAEDRCLNHLPYHRQEQIFNRQGASIPRSTMCGWMNALANIVRPVFNSMNEDLLQSKIIAIDDTPVKVLDRKKKLNIKRGHNWICIGDKEHPVNLFHYTEGRGRDGPKKFLPGFKGFLQGDCFSGNRALCTETGATLVACMAHARRYFDKALPNNKAASSEALSIFRDLFKIESDARELALSAHDVKKMRQEEALPILTKLKSWLDEHVITALPQSSFGKAVHYCLNNWHLLNNYLLDGDLRIDNNLSEQQMKLVAIGRKNWYFYGSDDSGETHSILLSLFSTALRHGLEPGAYLLDVVKRLTINPNYDPKQLVPYRWNPKQESAKIPDVKDTPQITFAH
jgi:transposase